jgi:hypothetical protein
MVVAQENAQAIDSQAQNQAVQGDGNCGTHLLSNVIRIVQSGFIRLHQTLRFHSAVISQVETVTAFIEIAVIVPVIALVLGVTTNEVVEVAVTYLVYVQATSAFHKLAAPNHKENHHQDAAHIVTTIL